MGTKDSLIGIKNPLSPSKRHVVSISKEEGFSNKHIFEIFEDSHGNLWIGSYSGLERIQRKPGGGFRVDSIFPKICIIDIFEDREKSLWLCTLRFGIKRLRSGRVKMHFEERGVPPYNNALYQAKNGMVWLGSNSGKLYRFEDDRFEEFVQLEAKENLSISVISEDNEGYILLGTSKARVFRVNPLTSKVLLLYEFPERIGRIKGIMVENSNEILLSTYSLGVAFYNPATDTARTYTE
ncbi:MAG: hypothetical protein GY765_08415, partial [bacterium]|nr:hypothetical protein [bacterium]